jgi:SAM-dependent methyltransferase
MSHASSPDDSPPPSLVGLLRTSTCPACGYHVAVPFYDGGRQPLTTLAWPQSWDEARTLARLPLTFVRCVDCGHVYNADFDYAQVPYSKKPCLMFNKGALWARHLEAVRDLLLAHLPERPTVVEVGCGEGHLLRALAAARPGGRYIGFDPNAAIDAGEGLIEARYCLFEPEADLRECRPDLIISRHVLEHLMNPLGFIQSIAFAATWEGLRVRLFIEVPCIDRALAIGRTSDFFYEHNSHFTTASLRRLLERCASDIELLERGYDDEVLFGLATFLPRPEQAVTARQALAFRDRAERSRDNVALALDRLAHSGRKVAIWGGIGKAAAFINRFSLDAERFPVVVDSDPDKADTFVPGTGQEIRFRDYLLAHPVDVIVIATQWRARDIVLEIERCGIAYQNIVFEHDGRLVDYFADSHPYH